MRDCPTLSQDSNQGVRSWCTGRDLRSHLQLSQDSNQGVRHLSLPHSFLGGLGLWRGGQSVRRRTRGQGIRQAELPPGMKARGRI